MEKCLCGSALVDTQTTGKRRRTIATNALWTSYRRPLRDTESIILYDEQSMTEVRTVCRVEKVRFWKIDFRHCVYFRSVR